MTCLPGAEGHSAYSERERQPGTRPWFWTFGVPDLLAGVAMAFVEHAAIKAVVAAMRQGRRSLGPLSVDGLILAASLVLLREARNDRDAPALARFMLWLGISATIGANIAHGAGTACWAR